MEEAVVQDVRSKCLGQDVRSKCLGAGCAD